VAPGDVLQCAAAGGQGELGEVGRVVAVARLRGSPAAGVDRRGRDGVGRLGAGGALDRDHVVKPALFEAQAEAGDVAVAGVGDRGPRGQSLAATLAVALTVALTVALG
jgi:hypothetical protein